MRQIVAPDRKQSLIEVLKSAAISGVNAPRLLKKKPKIILFSYPWRGHTGNTHSEKGISFRGGSYFPIIGKTM